MTVVGLDDTDSRDRGMCTTYLAAVLADRARASAAVDRLILVRLNPAVEHKTRGNAALAIHTTMGVDQAYDLAGEAIDALAETVDPATHPGLVVAPGPPEAVPPGVRAFAREAVRDVHGLDDAMATIEAAGYRSRGWKTGRGRIGALAAVGGWAAFEEWTVEHIAYRPPDRWGTPRDVDRAAVEAAAAAGYPEVWDTVDRGADEVVCVPRTPGPVLYGIRGEALGPVRGVAAGIESEPVDRTAEFVTNQGTDAHLRPGRIGGLEAGRAYRVDGTVATDPTTRRGGHVFFDLREGDRSITCAAFEPTKRFRDAVRSLGVGDRLTVCGEVTAGTLKLEKFAVRSLVETALATPDCPGCARSMESAGAEQGYRCRRCDTTAPRKVERPVSRGLDLGWYEVPPRARRHLAKPLVRGGFDAPTHPER